MKATELMIGDWVTYCWSTKLSYYQGQVKDVWNGGCHINAYSVKEDNIEPIPITPEILEKNGFVRVNTQRYDWGNPNGFYVNINPKKKIIHINGANGSNCNMYYIIVGFNVHELQRALRCCGLWDLANNFKI